VTAPVTITPYSFSGCWVQVAMKNDSEIDLDVSDAFNYTVGSQDLSDPMTTTPSGSWQLAAPKDTSGTSSCIEWTYQTKNGLGFRVAAEPGTDSGSGQPSGPAPDGPTLCNLARLTATAVANAMQKGAFKHLNYGTGSLASANGCDLLTASQVGAALGAKPQVEQSVTKHECTWDTSTGGQQGAVAYFEPDIMQQSADTSGGTLAMLGSHLTLVSPVQQQSGETLAGCSAETQIKVWSKWPGTIVVATPTSQYEYARIDAYVAGTDPNLACQVVQQLAKNAFAKLPPSQTK
jgi:hypothetical protein